MPIVRIGPWRVSSTRRACPAEEAFSLPASASKLRSHGSGCAPPSYLACDLGYGGWRCRPLRSAAGQLGPSHLREGLVVKPGVGVHRTLAPSADLQPTQMPSSVRTLAPGVRSWSPRPLPAPAPGPDRRPTSSVGCTRLRRPADRARAPKAAERARGRTRECVAVRNGSLRRMVAPHAPSPHVPKGCVECHSRPPAPVRRPEGVQHAR